ncbi:MAG: UDP-N-acetylmuramoyl-L-alanine--D-glutamate ligase, partial [Cyanobacteria bacterium REEB65]|nr:UDP-N-acetylmuramoyl-L-alanine--D-glutamate ligase [Cyanobacteria bacterium REEB65]
MPSTDDLASRTVAIIGMGRSGIAAAKYLAGLGSKVLLADSRPLEDLQEAIRELPEQ